MNVPIYDSTMMTSIFSGLGWHSVLKEQYHIPCAQRELRNLKLVIVEWRDGTRGVVPPKTNVEDWQRYYLANVIARSEGVFRTC